MMKCIRMRLGKKDRGRHFGWRKSPWDGRDFTVKMKLTHAQLSSVDLLQYVPAVRNQEDTGACVGFAMAAMLYTEAKKLNVVEDIFSPTWIYNGARALEGWLLYDDGCYPSDALDWLLKYGCLYEQFWPFVGFETKSPPSSLFPEAAKKPLVQYLRADNGIDGICNALDQGHCVVLGIPWPEKWMNSKDGVLSMVKVSDRIAGGHEILIYKSDFDNDRLQGMNSWGTTQWSYQGTKVPKGHFSFPMEFLNVAKQLGGYDANFVEVAWGNQPEPPEPEPEVADVLVKVSVDGGSNWADYIPA